MEERTVAPSVCAFCREADLYQGHVWCRLLELMLPDDDSCEHFERREEER